MELPIKRLIRLPTTAALMIALVLPAMLNAGTAQSQAADNGISFEEHILTFPPIPTGVHAEFHAGRVTVFWQAPETPGPADKLAYDPIIDSYRVYRLDRHRNRTLIGETTGTWFKDPAGPSGTVQRYMVTTVQRSGHESGPSQDIKLRIP